MSFSDPDTQETILSETEEDIREPSMYRVLLHTMTTPLWNFGGNSHVVLTNQWKTHSDYA